MGGQLSREIPPFHSITSSARPRSAGGISSLMARAVRWFIVKVTARGVSKGRSALLAPPSSRSTYWAAR